MKDTKEILLTEFPQLHTSNGGVKHYKDHNADELFILRKREVQLNTNGLVTLLAFSGTGKPATFACSSCGTEWVKKYSYVASGNSKCPACKKNPVIITPEQAVCAEIRGTKDKRYQNVFYWWQFEHMGKRFIKIGVTSSHIIGRRMQEVSVSLGVVPIPHTHKYVLRNSPRTLEAHFLTEFKHLLGHFNLEGDGSTEVLLADPRLLVHLCSLVDP